MTKYSRARTFGLLGASALLAASFLGCKSSSNNAANTAAINNGTGTDSGTDPAAGNLAPASDTQVLGSSSSYTPQQQGESYQQQPPAPVVQGYNDQDQGDEYAGEQAVDYADQPPPPLPDYDQPPAPDPNYIWTPGYWAWGDGGYYWVPGAWCPPPYDGALWTPPYWGYDHGRYGFHHGYWGPHIGYYGGVDYGYGYIGIGYFGGYWNGNNFYYNRSVTNVGRGGYTYDHPVVYNNVRYTGHIQNRTSYNGGSGGLNVRPRPSEMAALHETHAAPLPEQRQVAQAAAQNKQQFYSANHGKPAEIASARPVAAARPIAAPPAAVRQEQQHANQVRATMAQQTQQHTNAPGTPQRGAPVTEQRGVPVTSQRGAPVTEQRTMPQQQQRAMPQQQQRAMPQQQQRAMPQQQQRTMPQQQQRAMPQERAAPAPRPAPQQRPAPAPRPAPQQQRAAPAPQQRAAPAPRPAPQQRPAPARPEDKKPH
jgi:hypothetical protein